MRGQISTSMQGILLFCAYINADHFRLWMALFRYVARRLFSRLHLTRHSESNRHISWMYWQFWQYIRLIVCASSGFLVSNQSFVTCGSLLFAFATRISPPCLTSSGWCPRLTALLSSSSTSPPVSSSSSSQVQCQMWIDSITIIATIARFLRNTTKFGSRYQ